MFMSLCFYTTRFSNNWQRISAKKNLDDIEVFLELGDDYSAATTAETSGRSTNST